MTECLSQIEGSQQGPVAPLAPNGRFGHWIVDECGLPAYEYTCDQDNDPAAAVFTTQGSSDLHWHQVGNERLTAIATNRGEVQALESSRGLQWLNYRDRDCLCPGAGIAIVLDEEGAWTDLYQPGLVPPAYRRIFGVGYYRKIRTHRGLTLDHRIIAPFGDAPVLVGEIVVTNTTVAPREVTILEFFGVRLHYLIAKLIYIATRRRHYGLRFLDPLLVALSPLLDVERQRSRFARRFAFEPGDDETDILRLTPVHLWKRRPPPERRSDKNYYPAPLFMASLRGDADYRLRQAGLLLTTEGEFKAQPVLEEQGGWFRRDWPCLCLGQRLVLAPGESRRLAFLFGYEQGCTAAEVVARYRDRAAGPEDLLIQNGAAWRAHLPTFAIPDSTDREWVARETRWHAYYTRSAFLYDAYRRCHYTPQGGPYEFLHGLRGTVRDLAIYLAAIIYLDPGLAAELLEYCFWKMTPAGRLIYATVGYGQETGARVHERPSDLQLFLLWALTEYVFFTGDWAFLDREVPFYPADDRRIRDPFYAPVERTSSIREKVLLALDYLYREIGRGEHGLLRVGDGDWSDGISLFAPSRGRFVRYGESVFNSALALYVLPRVADLLETWDPAAAARAREYAVALREAVLHCFNGRWFYRAYDGAGQPIGDRELFLEHHAWLLIAGALPDDVARTVIAHVYDILDQPARFGQYILYPPGKPSWGFYQPGWDVNGGIWFAMDFLLAWGYGRYDPERAWHALRKNSLAYKATVDPAIWYGIWTGPDSFNADHAARPGETYFHLPTPATDFPAMNLNWHAGFLAALIKLCGVEPARDGLSVRPLLPFSDFALYTPTFALEVCAGQVRFRRQTEPAHHTLVPSRAP